MSGEAKEYDPGEIERLFFQMDNMLHTRVNSLLVAETVFFVAAATVWKDIALVLALCALGIVTTVLFTFTNLKLYWRVTWLIHQMRTYSHFYTDYIAMRGIRQSPGRWGRLTLWLMRVVASETPGKQQPRWLDSGWLFTWGLCIIAVSGWISLALVSVFFRKC
jgi:hypothetical protein